MALQSANLVMAALGLQGDAPPVGDQPPLVDGAHLRWTSPRARSFPWHGYYLYRRRSDQEARWVCCADRLPKAGQSPGVEVAVGDGRLSSPVALTFTDDFAPAGRSEADLRGREHLRFDRPLNRPMRQLRVTIGFRRAAPMVCLDFSRLDRLARLPVRLSGVAFALQARRRWLPALRRRAVRGLVSPGADETAMLVFDAPLEAELPEPCHLVELEAAGAGRLTLEALDARGRVVAETTLEAGHGLSPARLTGKAISRVRLTASEGVARLGRFCFVPNAGLAAAGALLVEALDQPAGLGPDAAIVVDSALAAGGAPGDVVTVDLAADRITGVRIAGGQAALIDVCWVEVDRALQGPWRPVPGCPQPLSLPVRHPDYPAWSGTIDAAQATQAALSRVRYGWAPDPTAPWVGQPVADLHDAALRLVDGGPAAGPMDAASRATLGVPAAPGLPGGAASPSLGQLHPLDMIMLGALHPPIAEMAGLAWTDETAQPGNAYDYMVVADHDGVSYGDPTALLTHLQTQGFDAGTDAWICHHVVVKPRPPFSRPADLTAYALPGGPLKDDAGDLLLVAGGVALTWPRKATPLGKLDPKAPLAHHVYRSGAGGGANPAVPGEAQDWLTRDRPLLFATPAGAPTTPPQTPPDWPPVAPTYLDLRLDEGWYVYQVVAVDLFGRFSPKSAFAPWWQWAPPPDPRPWYYGGTGAAEVHPQAVHILDKTRPPIPLGLQASVLDPDDPIVVKDAAYVAWRASLGAGGATTLGLRVRWRWSAEQQARAPNVTEFRLYWSAGSAPPSGWPEPGAWPTRFEACAYGAHVTNEPGGGRLYELFLPQPGGGPMGGGVPLAPTLAKPIAYANVSVTAADAKAHASDRWPGGGPYGGRVGNESQCAPPQKVFCVRRTPPPPPEAVVDSERVYATPADWRGRSVHTHRWLHQPNLFAHVLRALDEAVFAADWAAQPRPAIPLSDPAFPTEAIWTQAKKRRVATALNAIAALLPAAPMPAQKAAQKPAALALYRSLADDALRVLASRAGNEAAFVQLTVRPLAHADAPDRRGPDDDAGYVPKAARCAFLDEVDGRARNRLLYRTRFVDAAHNRGNLSLCSAPVCLPDVVAPAAPAIAKVLGGEREIELTWASNREPDLLEYRVFRAEREADAGALTDMRLVATVAADPNPAARPARVTWTDRPLAGLRDHWYRVVAVDRPDPDPRGGGGNLSEPSAAVRARAWDDTPPEPPPITDATWIRVDAAGGQFPYGDPIPPGEVRLPAIRVTWDDPGEGARVLLQAQGEGDAGFRNASAWLPTGATDVVLRSDRTFAAVSLQLKVINAAGAANLVFNPFTLAPP